VALNTITMANDHNGPYKCTASICVNLCVVLFFQISDDTVIQRRSREENKKDKNKKRKIKKTGYRNVQSRYKKNNIKN
jgi:hypothetical protein